MVKLLYSDVCVHGSKQAFGIQLFILQPLEVKWFGTNQTAFVYSFLRWLLA